MIKKFLNMINREQCKKFFSRLKTDFSFRKIKMPKCSGFKKIRFPKWNKEKFSKFSFMLQILIGPIAHARDFLMLGTGGARTGDKIC